MNSGGFFARLRAHPRRAPALHGARGPLSYSTLLDSVDALAGQLAGQAIRRLATRLPNGPAWVIADLAALRAGIVHVPLPVFFTEAQIAHALDAANVDALLAPRLPDGFTGASIAIAGASICLGQRAQRIGSAPIGTAKITFTSGTTGTPKGVCLSATAQLAVAASLAESLAPVGVRRHLCLLPLPVLLENIAGVYAPLIAGATVIVPPAAEVGLRGSSSFSAAALNAAVNRHGADSVITLPQMLRAWSAWRQATRAPALATLKFVAVGGAKVGAWLLATARQAGLPAFEGYGLSEAGSVLTLNLPHGDRPGSVGKPLPHAQIRIAEDGEVWVAGSLMLGYLGAPQAAPAWWPTGDLGRIDAEGFVHIDGRRRNVLVTAFGRNVSPEWVESALHAQPAIMQAAVFGEGQPALTAVLWPTRPDISDADLARSVAATNDTLPDYARISRWVRAATPFTAASGMATANGRPRRDAIARAHVAALAQAAFDSALQHRTDMPFFDRLAAETAAERAYLTSAPIILGTLQGKVSAPSYLAFLREAYHHVKHTVPLLVACKARLPQRLAWLAPELDEYIRDERGHDQWILNDIAALGGDPERVRASRPAPATELMVAYAYDTIARGNPVGFFGMVQVLEGTSVALALIAAERIQRELQLSEHAFSYLRSHGELDREHTAHLAALVNRLDEAADQEAIVHAAKMFYRLYGDVFRSLPLPAEPAIAEAVAA